MDILAITWLLKHKQQWFGTELWCDDSKLYDNDNETLCCTVVEVSSSKTDFKSVKKRVCECSRQRQHCTSLTNEAMRNDALNHQFSNLSFPCRMFFSILLFFHLPALPLCLPLFLGSKGIGPGLCVAWCSVEGSLELLKLSQKLPALLRSKVLGLLWDEHLNVKGHAVDLVGAGC